MIPQPTLDAPFNYPMRKKKKISKTSQHTGSQFSSEKKEAQALGLFRNQTI